MNRPGAAVWLVALLIFGVLTLWVEARWPWGIVQVSVFGALTGAVLVENRRRWHAVRHPAVWLLAAAVCWPLVQLAAGTTISRWQTWNWTLNWATYLALFAVALELCQAPEGRTRWLKVVAVFGAVLAAVAVLQMYSSGGRVFWLFPSGFTDNVLGPFVNRNQYAAFMELLLPAALWLAFHDRRRTLAWALAAAVMIGSVVAGASRAGTVLVLAEAALCVILAGRRRMLPRRQVAGVAAALALMAAVWVAVAGWEPLWQRLTAHDSHWLRREMLRASAAMVWDRPWTGTGMGTWADAYPHYAAVDSGLFVNQAHNDWACWAAEGGIPLVLLVAGVFASLARAAWRSLWGIGLLCVLLHGLVDYPMQQRPALGAWVFSLAGVVAANGFRTARTTSVSGGAPAWARTVHQ